MTLHAVHRNFFGLIQVLSNAKSLGLRGLCSLDTHQGSVLVIAYLPFRTIKLILRNFHSTGIFWHKPQKKMRGHDFSNYTKGGRKTIRNWRGGGHKILLTPSIELSTLISNEQSLNPIRQGGGGLRGPDDQIQSCYSETSYPMTLKLCDF